jgi:hypothetical protein
MTELTRLIEQDKYALAQRLADINNKADYDRKKNELKDAMDGKKVRRIANHFADCVRSFFEPGTLSAMKTMAKANGYTHELDYMKHIVSNIDCHPDWFGTMTLVLENDDGKKFKEVIIFDNEVDDLEEAIL